MNGHRLPAVSKAVVVSNGPLVVGATGVISYALPAGYDSVVLTIGMHYDNAVCRGELKVGGTIIFENNHCVGPPGRPYM
jgi:hypothetical protein